jgi:hypothetical protein
VKVISCLGSSLVNRVAVGWKVKTVGFDLVVVQSKRSNTSVSAHLLDKSALPENIAQPKYRTSIDTPARIITLLKHGTAEVGTMAVLGLITCDVNFFVPKRD